MTIAHPAIRVAAVALALGALACASPPRATSGPNATRLRPLTRAERSNFTETSTHADVMAFIDSLRAVSPTLHVTTLGRSTHGKDIPMLVLSRPAVRTAAEAKRTGRPIVYLQGNIHGGEVEGKEAILSLLRDLSRDEVTNVLDSLVIVAVPIYNIDGNDAMGPQERTRGAQQGPPLIGQRPNGQSLDLNRDYIKAEAPETRAALAMIREWDPHVFVDLHTTNGSYHGYRLTYAPSLNPAAIFTGPFTNDTVLPTLRNLLRGRHRIDVFPYGNFDSQDSVQNGWKTYDHRPRFGTNYYGLRGRVSILSEAYSHDPFATRVSSTYAFVRELLGLIAANRESFLDITREADNRTTGFASAPNASPPIAIRARLTRTPHVEEMLVEDLVRTGDSVRYEAGLRPGIRRNPARARRVPVYDTFEPALSQTIPAAWLIPAAQASLLEPLRRNGIFVDEVTQPVTLRVSRFTIDSVNRATRPFQGHQEVLLAGRWSASDTMTVPAGAFVVRAGQPLAVLALYMLEPMSDDGLVTWNFLDQWLQPGGTYPIARITQRVDASLRPATP